MDEQQQEQAAFERSFAETAGIELPAAAPAQPVAEAPAADPAPAESAAPVANEPAAAPAAPAGEGESPSTPVPEDDPVVFEGFKRSEVQRLLASASEVDGLKLQLRRANGKIGELNSRLQSPPTPPAAAPAPTAAPELPAELQQFEEDYPDVAKYVQARFGTAQPQPAAAPPAEAHQPVATGNAATAAEHDPANFELAVMDRVHSGWREKVQSQEFGLWLASQGEQVQQAYQTADTADGLGAVIGQYDQWATARQAATDKAAKSQQRLAKATTPSGNAPRPQAAPTEMDAMEAAFKRTLGL